MAISFRKRTCLNWIERSCPAGLGVVAALLLTGVFVIGSATAEARRQSVDLELVLAVDISSSMSLAEQRVQRDGYVNAFRHPDIIRAIKSGLHGKIGVAYIEWAGQGYPHVVVPWTVIGTDEESLQFADTLALQPLARGTGTSISTGLLLAEELLVRAWFVSERRVIDVSGDGPNNTGPPVAPIRDRLVAAGVTINGLPMALSQDDQRNFESFGQNYLAAYFEHCVIGGPSAFVIGIDDLALFEVAIRRKLVREIVGLPLRPQFASSRRYPAYDCTTPGQVPGR